jgi:hypothetical protein
MKIHATIQNAATGELNKKTEEIFNKIVCSRTRARVIK